MKKTPEIFSIFIVYLLTVPTNVMCLGAFTEIWLKTLDISRHALASLYLLSTVAVFLAMTLIKCVCSTKKIFLFLSLISLILVWIPNNVVALFLFFFLSQWLGQGYLVGQCRCRLFNIIPSSHYGHVVGFLEAMGTCAVFLCPFALLFLIQKWFWQMPLCLLSLIYMGSAFLFNLPQQATASAPSQLYKDTKFWLANFIIYLPVILISGLFFHLEGICKTYNISVHFWEHVSQIQAPGIILGQIFFGYFWHNHLKTVVLFVIMLIASQVAWLINLFYFNSIMCVVCGIIGWSLFGVLVNAFWSFLYRKQPILIDGSIKASVSFGFLANAIGPISFCAFL